MQANGVLTREEFAFYFASQQEAETEGGPEVAVAWQQARMECQRGLATRVTARAVKHSRV